MFSIGLPEIAIIFLVLILFIKPEDIPKVFQSLGRWYGKLQRLYIGVTDEFRELSYDLDMRYSKTTYTERKGTTTEKETDTESSPVSFIDKSHSTH